MGRPAKHPVQSFFGVSYYKTPRGYFKAQPSCGGEYMHRAVWFHFNGPIPVGFSVHHRDENRANNDISNLELMSTMAHNRMHTQQRLAKDKTSFDTAIKAAQSAARAWHSSPDGLAWHSEHSKRAWAARQSAEYRCTHCSRLFTRLVGVTKKGYCSPSCQTAARKKSGVDRETRSCAACGSQFAVDRYSKTKNCSRQCGIKSANEARKRKTPP